MIHALWRGVALCGAGFPSTWSPGTRWVSRADAELLGEVNCPGCREELDGPGDCDDDLVVRLRHDDAGKVVAAVPVDDKDCDGPEVEPGGVDVEHARVLVEAGVREALRDVGHRRADVAPLVEAVIGRLVGPKDDGDGPGSYPDPRLCEHLARECRNCGRGLAHDEPCAMPPAEPDRFDDDCDGDERLAELAAALPADGSTTATAPTPRWWIANADGKLAHTTEPPPVAPVYWPDDVRCRCVTIPIVDSSDPLTDAERTELANTFYDQAADYLTAHVYDENTDPGDEGHAAHVALNDLLVDAFVAGRDRQRGRVLAANVRGVRADFRLELAIEHLRAGKLDEGIALVEAGRKLLAGTQ